MLSPEGFLADWIKEEIDVMQFQVSELETQIEALQSMLKKREEILVLLDRRRYLDSQRSSLRQRLDGITQDTRSMEDAVASRQKNIENQHMEIIQIAARHEATVQQALATKRQIDSLKSHGILSQDIVQAQTLEKQFHQQQMEADETETKRKMMIDDLDSRSYDNSNAVKRLKMLQDEGDKCREDLQKSEKELADLDRHIKHMYERFSQKKFNEENQELDAKELSTELQNRMDELAQLINATRSERDQAKKDLENLMEQRSRITPGDISTIETIAALVCLKWADHKTPELTNASDISSRHKIFADNFRWSSWRNLPPEKLSLFLMKELAPVVRSLFQDTHNQILPEIAQVILPLQTLINRPPSILAILIKWFDQQPFETPSDKRKLLGIFDDLLKSITSKKSGFSTTPAQIARLVAALAEPSRGDTVYDPCFGYAEMLNATFDQVQEDDKPSITFVGAEKSAVNYVIGLARLILSGITDAKLQFDNSRGQDLPQNPIGGGFNIVVSHMRRSFSMNERRPGMVGPQAGVSSSQSISHALSKTCQGGRAVLVVPEITLFRGGPDSEFRERLIRENQVEAILSLPEGAIDPGSRLRDVILVVRRGGQTKKVRMVDAEAFFERTSRREPYVIKPGQINELVSEAQNPKPLDHGWNVSVESLAELSWDLSVRRRDQSELLAKLESLRGCEVVQLGDFCEIIEQPHLPNQELSDAPKSGNSIRYVGIRDLRGGIIAGPSKWMSIDSSIAIQDSWKLQDGDILLPRFGAIGKASVVRKKAIGSIAARRLFVIRCSSSYMEPIFLAAYLESSQVRTWIREHTVGGTRGHLTERILLTLPVPFPRLDYQQDLGTRYFQNGDDVLVSLYENFTLDTGDPVALWLERSLNDLFSKTINLHKPLEMDLFETLYASMGSIRLQSENERIQNPNTSSEAKPLDDWCEKFRNAISLLLGLKHVPLGPSLLNILQKAVNGIRESLGALKQHTPIMEKAQYMSNLAIKMIQESIDALFLDIKLDFRVHDKLLRAGTKAEINLAIIHKGFLPLRYIVVRSSPDWGQTYLAFLAEGSTESMALEGIAPETSGDFIIDINWYAVTLDGEVIEGKTELPFRVTSDDFLSIGQSGDMGRNPYVTGTPISPDRDDVFFGREDLLTNIKGQIEKSGNVIFLEGNRRAGKTSILNHLKGLGPVDGWLGVYCSLQAAEGAGDATGVPTVEVFREIARSIANELRVNEIDNPLPDGSVLSKGQKLGIAKACRRGIGEESPFKDFEDYLEQTLLTLKEAGLGLLLMLDEFDKLQQGIDNGITSPQTPENIRYLIQTYPNFSAILTGTRRLKKLREEYWSVFFGMGTYFGVSSLSFGAAERLITEPVRDKLTYSPEAVKRAIYSTARQPYLLQLLCNRVFDLFREFDSRTVTLDLVKEAEHRLVQDDVHFTSLWDYVGSDRRRFILALCHGNSLSDTPYPFNFQFIFEQLLAYEIDVNEDSLESDLAELRELELIQLDERPNSSQYLMGIPLLGAWIDRQQDLSLLERKARTETEEQNE